MESFELNVDREVIVALRKCSSCRYQTHVRVEELPFTLQIEAIIRHYSFIDMFASGEDIAHW